MPACHLSFFNYLILWAGIWLVAAMVFITFHRAKRIRFIQSSIFIVLIVITVGPLSVLNISEYFLGKRLVTIYSGIKGEMGNARIPRYHGKFHRAKAYTALRLLDLCHGYSRLRNDFSQDSPQAIWAILRCEGYDIIRLLQEIPVDLGRYLVMLYSFDNCRSCWAAEQIGKLGESAIPAVPHLIEMLERSRTYPFMPLYSCLSNYCSPQSAARKALIQIGSPAKPYLIHAYRNRSKDIVHQIFQIFRSKETDYGHGLLAAMIQDPSSLNARLWTAQFLGKRLQRGQSDCRAGAMLIDALRDPAPKVRAMAARSLVRLDYAPAAKPLTRLLLDNSTLVKIEAANALGDIGRPIAIGALIGLLELKDEKIQAAAAKALHKITDEKYAQNYRKWTQWWQQCTRRRLDTIRPLKCRKLPNEPVIPYYTPKYTRQ